MLLFHRRMINSEKGNNSKQNISNFQNDNFGWQKREAIAI